jgi:anti-anti-sigma factor
VPLGDLRHELRAEILYASLSGEVDMSNADELREALLAAMPNGAHGLVLDLSAIGYLDSAGIHLIFRLRDSLARRGQRMRIVIPDDSPINDTLRLAGVERGEEMVSTVQAAESALGVG